jgi:signal peptidase I
MRNRDKYIFWGKAILIALLLVFAVRTFWVESYLISSSQMEATLLKGDRVVVDKTAYGLRLPITPFSLPFVFDNVFGLPSYSSAVEFPYSRIASREIPVNDVVVYNHPLQSDRPLDKRMLCIGRCVAQPGDTIQINGFELRVNGRMYHSSPDFTLAFRVPRQWEDSLRRVFRQLSFPSRKMAARQNQLSFPLNKLEAYILREHFPDSVLQPDQVLGVEKCRVVIPRRGMTLKLNRQLINIYSYLIRDEQGQDADVRQGKLYINGKWVHSYTFSGNYYWMLSDNQVEAIDSRHLGFIPEKNIVGKVAFIWFSSESVHPRWERIFSPVK